MCDTLDFIFIYGVFWAEHICICTTQKIVKHYHQHMINLGT